MVWGYGGTEQLKVQKRVHGYSNFLDYRTHMSFNVMKYDKLKKIIKILCNAAELAGRNSRQSIRVHMSEGDLLPFE